MKHLRTHRLGILAIVAAVISGCAGTATNLGSNPLPETPLAHSHKGDTQARFTIHWPALSPSAGSIVVEINDDVKTATIVNAPATGKPTATTTTVAAPAGHDTFDFTLYDRKQNSASKPIGNVLGRGTLEHNVIANKVSVIRVAVAGVIAGIAITEAPNQPFVAADPRSAGFDFIGNVPASFIVTAQDADGNALVPQPANLRLAPSVTSTGFLKVARPNRGKQPQTFLVTLIQGLPPGQRAAIVATAIDSFGNHAESSATINEASAIYASYSHVPHGASPIVLYNAGTGTSVSLPGAFSGLGAVSALAYDSVDHELLVGDSSHGIVDAFDVAGKAVPGFNAIHAAGVIALAYDPNDQEIYVAANAGVTAYSKSGTPVALSSGAFKQTTLPCALAFVQPNTIAVGQKNGGGVGVYSESGVYATGSSFPLTAVVGIATNYLSPPSAAATVFVTGAPLAAGEVNLFEVTPGQGPLTLASVADPRAVAQDPGSGDIYIASGSRNEILSIAYGTWTHGRAIQSTAGYSTPVALAVTY